MVGTVRFFRVLQGVPMMTQLTNAKTIIEIYAHGDPTFGMALQHTLQHIYVDDGSLVLGVIAGSRGSSVLTNAALTAQTTVGR